MERKTTQIGVRLTPSEVERAQQLAELTNVSMSEVFRLLLREARVMVRPAVVEVQGNATVNREMMLA